MDDTWNRPKYNEKAILEWEIRRLKQGIQAAINLILEPGPDTPYPKPIQEAGGILIKSLRDTHGPAEPPAETQHNRFWVRYSDGVTGGRSDGDQLIDAEDKEMAAISFWHLNKRNHRLPVAVKVITLDNRVGAVVEVVHAVVAKQLYSYMVE